MRNIKIKCPAKINYTLKIIGKREDGFHEIESVMQTISLYDYLSIHIECTENNDIILSGNSDKIPYDENNLVYRAIKLYMDSLGKKYKYKIFADIKKNIPTSAGLAGGSTDAAGALFGMNKLFNDPFDNTKMHALCAKLGSDLNFCLIGGTQLTKGRGEILHSLPYKEQKISLIKPTALGISAKEAYAKFAQKYSKNPSSREVYVNDLEWALIDDYPELQKIKTLYPKSVMSGSGSTYYIVNDSFKPLAGYQIFNDLHTTPYGVCEV